MFRRVGAAVLVAAAAAGCRLPLPARLPHPLVVNIALSVAGFFATSRMTLAMVPAFVKARLSGIDLNKPQTKHRTGGVTSGSEPPARSIENGA